MSPRSAPSARPALAALALAALALAAPPAHAQGGSAVDKARASAEAVARSLREYVYAGYDVTIAGEVPQEGASQEEIDRLYRARDRVERERARLIEALRAAGLGALADQGDLGQGLMGELASYFEVSSPDLRFLPREVTGGALRLVRVAERREVPERALPGARAPVAYRVVAWDEVLIDSLARYRSARAEAPLAGAAGRTVYLDRDEARRTARDRVIARVPDFALLAGRAARGEALAPAEVKDLLRYRALAGAIAEGGEEEVARAIIREEESRMAALFAALGAREARALTAAEDLERTAAEATLLAIAAGDPRYQVASALALTLAAPEAPAAAGARRALVLLAGADAPHALLPLRPEDLRSRALAGLRR